MTEIERQLIVRDEQIIVKQEKRNYLEMYVNESLR